MLPMTLDPTQLPNDIATLKAMVIAAERKASDRGLEIEALKLTIAKLQRNTFGASSESGKKLLDQLELQLAELEEGMAEDKASAAIAAPPALAAADKGEDGQHRKPARRPLPSHLPRERVVHAAPSCCPGCGGSLRKLGEDVTETLEHVPAQWKVISHVREKFACRDCEAITEPAAPSHPIPRGFAGPSLLAMMLVAKTGDGLTATINSFNHDPHFADAFPASVSLQGTEYHISLSANYRPSIARSVE